MGRRNDSDCRSDRTSLKIRVAMFDCSENVGVLRNAPVFRKKKPVWTSARRVELTFANGINLVYFRIGRASRSKSPWTRCKIQGKCAQIQLRNLKTIQFSEKRKKMYLFLRVYIVCSDRVFSPRFRFVKNRMPKNEGTRPVVISLF